MERGLKGREGWRKAGFSVEEAAVALPWAPAFYVPAVRKRISQAERLPIIRAAQFVFLSNVLRNLLNYEVRPAPGVKTWDPPIGHL